MKKTILVILVIIFLSLSGCIKKPANTDDFPKYQLGLKELPTEFLDWWFENKVDKSDSGFDTKIIIKDSEIAEQQILLGEPEFDVSSLPSDYETLRTSIKDQAQNGTCWAFATTGSIESALIVQLGVDEINNRYPFLDTSDPFNSIDLSEQYVAYYNLDWELYREASGWHLEYQETNKDAGGNAFFSTYNLYNRGVPLESDLPYLSEDYEYIKFNATDNSWKEHLIKTDGTIVIPSYTSFSDYNTYINTIKSAIVKYGAIACSIRVYDPSFYIHDGLSVYMPQSGDIEGGGHAVLLIGWYDHYDDSEGSGYVGPVWVFKNSWGYSWGLIGTWIQPMITEDEFYDKTAPNWKPESKYMYVPYFEVQNHPPSAPFNMQPEYFEIDVPVDTVLSWESIDVDGDALTYDIYFGTSPTPTLVASDSTDTTYDPGLLEYEQTYYWKIVAKDIHGAKRESSVRYFKTKSPGILFEKTFGGSDWDESYSIQQTSDGGYIVAGYALSNNGDVFGNHGSNDYWIVKLDETGNIQWQKCLGGSYDDRAYSIQQTSDDGFIVAGTTYSNDGDVSGKHGSSNDDKDYWIVKLDKTGNIEWQKCLGGSDEDIAQSIQQTSDGGYIVAGHTSSNNGDVSGNHSYIGKYDYWIVKLDETGNIQWQKCLGGSERDEANNIQQTSDGGYIVAGETWSNNEDVSGNHGSNDYWIVKLDETGNIQWQKCLGGSSYDSAYSIQQTSDGGYIVAGYTFSNNGDVSGNHSNSDYWIVKLDETGNIQWQKCLGGSSNDYAYSIHQTSDGGYIVAGSTDSNNGDVSGNHGNYDYWLVKLDVKGEIQWQKCLGGSSSDGARSIQKMNDGGYIVTGYTKSNDGDVSGNHGSSDYWIVKLE